MRKPKSKRGKRELKEFAEWRAHLHRVYEKADARREDRGQRTIPRRDPINAFRLAAYEYYVDLKDHDLLGALRAYVEERDGARWTGHDDHEVQWVVRLARGGAKKKHAHDSSAAYKHRRRDGRIGAELKLAAINRVKPGLLIGFLYEVGSTSKVERDAKAGKKYGWAVAYR